MERRIAAIVAADMVGFSRLVEVDETGTLERQKRHFAELIDPALTQHNGNIIKTTGDGLIAEFPSVVDAVRCSVHIQKEMVALEEDIPDGLKIRYRIGINLGDVIFDDGDVFGDGVNVAARLEGLAEPGGVVVSGTAHDMLKANVDVGYEDLGEQQVKNIATPVRVYRVVPEGQSTVTGRPSPATPRQPGKKPSVIFAGALVALLAVIGAVLWSSGWLTPHDDTGSDQRRIAVLPFANISGDPDNAYFSDGLTEEMISRLSRIGELGVIARTSAMRYKDTDKGIDQIGRELSVGTVLEGSVRKAGDRVRITAQLIDVASQEHLWSADYDRDLEDVFAIQSEISEAVTQALKLALVSTRAPSSPTKGADNIEAYTLYLKGQYMALNNWTKDAHEQSISFYEQALAIDPDYAPAYAGLAHVLNKGTLIRAVQPSEAHPKAKEMAERALALDPNLADAWYALAYAEIDGYWDWEAGEQALKRALEIDPNHALALSYYAHRLLGAVYLRHDEAIATMERVVALDPLSLAAQNRLLMVLRNAGKYDRAIEQGHKTIETWPNSFWPYYGLSTAYSAKGKHDEAIQQALVGVKVAKQSSIAVGNLANIYARAGRREEALPLVAELEQRAKTTPAAVAALAFAYSGVGEVARMMDALERLYERRSPYMVFLRVAISFAPYRSDPRFVALMKRVGLLTD